jgi:hypothetical protein
MCSSRWLVCFRTTVTLRLFEKTYQTIAGCVATQMTGWRRMVVAICFLNKTQPDCLELAKCFDSSRRSSLDCWRIITGTVFQKDSSRQLATFWHCRPHPSRVQNSRAFYADAQQAYAYIAAPSFTAEAVADITNAAMRYLSQRCKI